MMNPIPTRTLLLLLFLPSVVAVANFTLCLEDFKRDPSAVGGVNSQGQPVSSAEAVGLTYETCMIRCGTSTESFMWGDFARSFSSWLLPWLALLSQLPFGSSNYVDDFISGWLSFRLIAGFITYQNTLSHLTSYHKCWVPRAGRILPRPHLPKHSVSLS